jgi:hypothetical protein
MPTLKGCAIAKQWRIRVKQSKINAEVTSFFMAEVLFSGGVSEKSWFELENKAILEPGSRGIH